MLTETPVTQRSPCYSEVSSSLVNPLPDCSNYSPFCHTHYLTLGADLVSGLGKSLAGVWSGDVDLANNALIKAQETHEKN